MPSKKLRALSNDAIDSRLRELDDLERKHLLEFVFLLAEMGRRDLHLQLGFNSLFTYCAEGLCLEKSFAYRRSTAAQLVLRFPIIASYLRDGRLSVTTLVPLRKILKPENYLKTLDQAAGLSEAKVKRLAAALAPRKVTRDVERRLAPPRTIDLAEFGFSTETASSNVACAEACAPPPPTAKDATASAATSTTVSDRSKLALAAVNEVAPRNALVGRASDASASRSELLPSQNPALVALPAPPPRIEPICAEYTRVAFTADDEFMTLLASTRSALSHVVPDGGLLEVFRHAMKVALDQSRRRKVGAGLLRAPSAASITCPAPQVTSDGASITTAGTCAKARLADGTPRLVSGEESVAMPTVTADAVGQLADEGLLPNIAAYSARTQVAMTGGLVQRPGPDQPAPPPSDSALSPLAAVSSTARNRDGKKAQSRRPIANSADALQGAEAKSVSVLKPILSGELNDPRQEAPADRYVPEEVRVAVWRRDHGCCAFTGPGGHRCGSDWQLEFAHVLSFARGGPATVENIALRCRDHNQHEARMEFGSAFMKTFTGGTPDHD